MPCFYCGKGAKKATGVCMKCVGELWQLPEDILQYLFDEAVSNKDEGKIQVLRVLLESKGSKI